MLLMHSLLKIMVIGDREARVDLELNEVASCG